VLTAVFDENTLPKAARREHRTKPGVWCIIRVLEGRLRYRVLDPPSESILDPGLVRPDERHLVEPGPITSCPNNSVADVQRPSARSIQIGIR
jgi:tellurite resistance-related uncharacterized protein